MSNTSDPGFTERLRFWFAMFWFGGVVAGLAIFVLLVEASSAIHAAYGPVPLMVIALLFGGCAAVSATICIRSSAGVRK